MLSPHTMTEVIATSNCVVLKVSRCVRRKACVFIYVGIAAYVSHAIWF